MVIVVALVSSCGESTSTSSGTGEVAAALTHGDSIHSGGHLVLESAAVMGRPDRVVAGPQGNDGQFVVECPLSHLGADDPILYPDRPGASHLHAFFGNTTTSARSMYADLLGTETTCDDRGDTAAYWVPVLMDGATAVEPVYSVAYYRAGIDVDPTSVVAFPPGLMMIAGDPVAEVEQPREVVAWSCGQGAQRSITPTTCPSGVDVRLWVTFPDCWDGVNLDVPGHRRHVQYSSGGHCPDSHPVHIPQMVFAVDYAVEGDVSAMRLSSGSLMTAHADFINAWDQDRLEHKVDLCIRRQHVCGISSGRRPV